MYLSEMLVAMPEYNPTVLTLSLIIFYILVILIARAYVKAMETGRARILVIPWPDPKKPYRFLELVLENDEGV